MITILLLMGFGILVVLKLSSGARRDTGLVVTAMPQVPKVNTPEWRRYWYEAETTQGRGVTRVRRGHIYSTSPEKGIDAMYDKAKNDWNTHLLEVALSRIEGGVETQVASSKNYRAVQDFGKPPIRHTVVDEEDKEEKKATWCTRIDRPPVYKLKLEELGK